MTEPKTMFEHVGGMPFFTQLVERFYEGVELDSLLRRWYPEDLEPGKHALVLFLAQYWGGPGTYSEVQGHPRLRMRHNSFTIGQAERDAWFRHMSVAVESSGIDDPARQQMLDYFAMAADHLINAAPAG